MKKSLLSDFVAASLIAICLFVFSGVVFGDTVYVDPNGFADFTTIQAAISDPNTVAGDVVIVRPGTYVENINMQGKAITLRSTDPLDGAVVLATIINGNAAGRVITCNSGENNNTLIEGFLITNGSDSQGGGMYNDDSSPTVTNCAFSNNTANAGGGLYNNYHSSPMVSNCTFNGNRAIYGSGMHNNDSSPTVNNCSFSGNTATEYGGGMCNNNYSSPTMNNCTFSGNTADAGGGMYNNDDSSPVVNNCTFSGNTADYGCGMYNNDSSPTVTNCTFTNNTATHGGGMENYESNPTVTNCTFSGNAANKGGGMYNKGSSPVLSNCTFSRNTTGRGGYGGGMYNDNSSSPTLSNCTFSGNASDFGGGGMYTHSGSPQVSDSYFCTNTPDQIDGPWSNNGGNVISDDYCPPPRPLEPGLAGDISGDGTVDLVDFAIIADRMQALILIAQNWLAGTEP